MADMGNTPSEPTRGRTAAHERVRALDDGAREVLLAQETALTYPRSFGSEEAFDLGRAVREIARDYDRGIACEVVRESDGLILFAWAQDAKAPRNYRFCAGKRAAALRCGHASLMCYVEHELDGSWDELFQAVERRKRNMADADESNQTESEELIYPVGGAFPIRVGDDGAWVATLAISGLHEGLDHEFCVRALSAALGKRYGTEVPAYRYHAV